jgi:hypothetical protein
MFCVWLTVSCTVTGPLSMGECPGWQPATTATNAASKVGAHVFVVLIIA